jgi:hypothetical protein
MDARRRAGERGLADRYTVLHEGGAPVAIPMPYRLVLL